jgi:hypothetical protein
MSSITMTKKTDITPSGFGMPVYGCAFPQAIQGASIAAARVRLMGLVAPVRHIGGAVLSVTGPVAGTVPGHRAWSPPI